MNAEQQEEWDYRYQERLGMLCGADRPTLAQRETATTEANQWLKDSNPQQNLI